MLLKLGISSTKGAYLKILLLKKAFPLLSVFISKLCYCLYSTLIKNSLRFTAKSTQMQFYLKDTPGERGFEPLTCGFGNRCSTIGTILLRNEEALLGLLFPLKLSIPYGDRTRVTALKKRCPNH